MSYVLDALDVLEGNKSLEEVLADPDVRTILRRHLPRESVPTCVEDSRAVAGITGYVLVDNYRERVQQWGLFPWDTKKFYGGEQLVLTPEFELLLLSRAGEYVPGKGGGWAAEARLISAAEAEKRFGGKRIRAALARPLYNALAPLSPDD